MLLKVLFPPVVWQQWETCAAHLRQYTAHTHVQNARARTRTQHSGQPTLTMRVVVDSTRELTASMTWDLLRDERIIAYCSCSPMLAVAGGGGPIWRKIMRLCGSIRTGMHGLGVY